jgi:hypothetical protein
MDLVVAKFRNFREAEEATRPYYRRLSATEWLEILFKLRDLAHKEGDAASQGLARVYRIKRLPGRAQDQADLEALGAAEEH